MCRSRNCSQRNAAPAPCVQIWCGTLKVHAHTCRCKKKKLRVCIAFIHIGNQLAPRAQSSMSYHTILRQFFITRSCTQWVSVIPPWGGGLAIYVHFLQRLLCMLGQCPFHKSQFFILFYSCVHSGYYCDKTFPSMFFLLWLCLAMKHVHNLDLV